MTRSLVKVLQVATTALSARPRRWNKVSSIGNVLCVPLPLSKSQINKLGSRIAASAEPNADDQTQLRDVIRYYQIVLNDIKSDLDSLRLGKSASRVKTHGTLIEKLQRESGMELVRVQDLAGARVIIAGGRIKQDDAVRAICDHFSNLSRPAKIIDRRVHPSHGYRAVHIIIFPADIQVEIQVRTELQNAWAQIVERLGDIWGRDIRYGGLPIEPERLIRHSGITAASSRRQLVELTHALGEHIAVLEQRDVELEKVKAVVAAVVAGKLNTSRALAAWREHQLEVSTDVAVPLVMTGRRKIDRASIARAFKPAAVQMIRQTDLGRRQRGRAIRRAIYSRTVTQAELERQFAEFNKIALAALATLEKSADKQRNSVRDTMDTIQRLIEEGNLR